MVSTYPLDYMHLVCLGQMKKMLNLWLKESTRIKCRLSGEQIKNLSLDMLALKKYVCSEFEYQLLLKNWIEGKPRNFEFFYYIFWSYFVVYFPYNYLKHFIAFHCAI